LIRNLVSDYIVDLILRKLAYKHGIDLTQYKKEFLRRRIYARMVFLHIDSAWRYLKFLEKNPQEVYKLLDNIAINVSCFFRDPHIWKRIEDLVFVPLLKRKSKIRGSLRIWSAGCSYGEEPYTIAILLKELMDILKCKINVYIYATDIDATALRKGELGIYRIESLRNVDKRLLLKYFNKNIKGDYVIRGDLKRMVLFKRHNLLKDRPLSNMDIVFCRNVLIYFDKQAQHKVIHKFIKSLRLGGYLILGATESLDSSFLEFFEIIDLRARIYRLRRKYSSIDNYTFL